MSQNSLCLDCAKLDPGAACARHIEAILAEMKAYRRLIGHAHAALKMLPTYQGSGLEKDLRAALDDLPAREESRDKLSPEDKILPSGKITGFCVIGRVYCPEHRGFDECYETVLLQSTGDIPGDPPNEALRRAWARSNYCKRHNFPNCGDRECSAKGPEGMSFMKGVVVFRIRELDFEIFSTPWWRVFKLWELKQRLRFQQQVLQGLRELEENGE